MLLVTNMEWSLCKGRVIIIRHSIGWSTSIAKLSIRFESCEKRKEECCDNTDSLGTKHLLIDTEVCGLIYTILKELKDSTKGFFHIGIFCITSSSAKRSQDTGRCIRGQS